ncbi:MAG: hypothetical protein HY800_10100 [Ignavibacteriales bacterium]|nr:hypothetical protein [Ignavibacteriales bacterium]
MTKFTFIILSFFFSSCMHMMMNDNHRQQDHNTDSTLQKEVIMGQIKATAMFPPLEINKETEFSLRLVDVTNTKPISGATVMAHIEYVSSDDNMKHDPYHQKEVDSQSKKHWSIELTEGKQAGLYLFKQEFAQTGEYIIQINVLSVQGIKLEPVLIIDARKNVFEHPNSHGGGMLGKGSSTTYIILGASLMVAMMVGMFIVRGSIF